MINEHGDRCRDTGSDDRCRDCWHSVEDCVCPVEDSPWREVFGEEDLSGSKVTDSELRQVCDTSEGSSEMAATCCGLENRHEESAPAQTLSSATEDLRLDQTESLSQWYDEKEN